MSKIQITQKAPDFVLEDFSGKTVELANFHGRKNVVLVFNRGFF